jgi:C-terminal processing protease CtpA/Prc
MTVMTDKLDNPYGLGSRQTFTPDLGAKIWETGADNSFYAYIYMTPERKLIGYIRIAQYIMPDYNKAVADFAAIIQRFQAATDSMIIDQVNNPGGSVFYLYSLASMLTDQPLHTPLHHMSITQQDVMGALQTKARYQNVKNDEEARKAATADDGADGYPVNYEFARFMVSYADFLIDQWTQGHHISEPYWIGGVNQINPAPIHYTKPILLLTNHLDFSGGDFFPAIMQDNHRVKIFGTRTAGAGGYILQEQYANNLGVALYSVTGSIAARLSGNPIENLGITPDVEYEMTAEDYQNNYGPYIKAVQATVNGLMQ